MKRREFLASGLGGPLVAVALGKGHALAYASKDDEIRAAFPRLAERTYLNAAGMMPLSTFSEDGLRRYTEFQRLGSHNGRGEYVQEVQAEIRGLFSNLVGAPSHQRSAWFTAPRQANRSPWTPSRARSKAETS